MRVHCEKVRMDEWRGAMGALERRIMFVLVLRVFVFHEWVTAEEMCLNMNT